MARQKKSICGGVETTKADRGSGRRKGDGRERGEKEAIQGKPCAGAFALGAEPGSAEESVSPRDEEERWRRGTRRGGGNLTPKKEKMGDRLLL